MSRNKANGKGNGTERYIKQYSADCLAELIKNSLFLLLNCPANRKLTF